MFYYTLLPSYLTFNSTPNNIVFITSHPKSTDGERKAITKKKNPSGEMEDTANLNFVG